MTKFASSRRDRFAAAALALAMQAVFVVLLIFSHAPTGPAQKSSPELTYVLPRLPRLIEPPRRRAPKAVAGRGSVAPSLPDAPILNPELSSPALPDLRNLGRALSDCAPELWSSLTPQRRAHCAGPGEGVAVQTMPKLLDAPGHVKDEARWAAELAREKSPLLIPGADPDRLGLNILTIRGEKISGLTASIANGAIAKPQSWFGYGSPRQFMSHEPAAPTTAESVSQDGLPKISTEPAGAQ